MDHNWPQIPRFAKIPNEWFFTCQQFVRNTITMYASLLGYVLTYNVLNTYRRSYADEEKAEQFFMRYDVPYHEIVKDEHYYNAINIVTDWFRPTHKIHPVHFTDLRWYPFNISTNAERPFSHDVVIKRKLQIAKSWNLIDNARMSFHNCYQEIFTYTRKYIHQIKNGLTVPLHPIDLHVKPALVSSDDPDKVRTVFGVPKPLIFAEAMFLWPLFSNYFTLKHTPILWNYETLNGGWLRLNDEYHRYYKAFTPIFNLDWSEFDMRVYFSMWKDIRDETKSYFCFCGNYCPTTLYPESKTDPQRLHNLWNWTEKAYFETPCVTTTGKTFKRNYAGMPSGIFGTQFWDTLINGTMVVTVLLSLGFEVSKHHFIKLMGDDVLFGLLSHVPVSQWADFLEAFADEANRRFNSKLSPKKCGASERIHGAQVLSYFNWNGYPTRSAEQLLAQLLHPKSLRDTYPRLMARAIGIYYASAGDPKIRPICEHIYSELKHAGYEPHVKGFSGLFDPNTFFGDIPLDHFPSLTEVISRLTSPSSRNEEQQTQYWDRSHFLFEAGSSGNCPDLPN